MWLRMTPQTLAGPMFIDVEPASRALARTRLLDHLLRGGDLPSGLDAVKAAAVADAQRRERTRLIADACPALVAALGRRFAPLVRAHVAQTAVRDDGDGDGDAACEALRFARSLDPGIELGDPVRAELLALRARATHGRTFAGATRLRGAGRLLIVVRLPGAATHIVALRIARPQFKKEPPGPVCGPATAPDRSSSSISSSR
jgi:hypothetical protein